MISLSREAGLEVHIEEHDDPFLYDLYEDGNYGSGATMRSSPRWKSTLTIDRRKELGPMDDLAIFLGYTSAILLILGIGGLIADLCVPPLPLPSERFIDSLPSGMTEE